jgi:ATP-dependent RNA helicase RhlE
MTPQFRALGRGVDILVATPGRLMDHASQNTVDLRQVEILVLDEADRMLDMGFIRDIRKILTLLPEKRQNLLFSATFSQEIKALADELLDSPQQITIGTQNVESALVTQSAYMTHRDNKRSLLVELIRQHDMEQALVFTRTKHGADRLASQLEMEGIATATIHSNRSQSQRMSALSDFKAGTVRILVATDIAARGLDIVQLPYVVNYDLPNVPEDYVHRIGRTGRAGSIGEAISLVSSDEHKFLTAIEKLIKRKLERRTVDEKRFPSGATTPSASLAGGAPAPAQSSYSDRPESRSRKKPRVEVQWGESSRPQKGISSVPRHKRRPARPAQASPAPFARFMPRGANSSRNG